MLAAFIYFTDFRNKSAFITRKFDSSLYSTWLMFLLLSFCFHPESCGLWWWRWCWPQTCPATSSRLRPWRTSCNSRRGQLPFPPLLFTLPALTPAPAIYIFINPAIRPLFTNHPLLFQLTLPWRVYSWRSAANIHVSSNGLLQTNKGWYLLLRSCLLKIKNRNGTSIIQCRYTVR